MDLVKPKKIFIVDSDQSFATSLKKHLTEKANHEVTIFDQCTDCLKSISGKPDVIILDNHLNTHQPDEATNLQLLEIIRKDYPDIHVIVVGDNEGYGTAMQTILIGAEQYLMKDKNTIASVSAMVDEL